MKNDQATQVETGVSFAQEMKQVFVDWVRALPTVNKDILKDSERESGKPEQFFSGDSSATGGHMFKENSPPDGSLPEGSQGEDAVFKGWQKTGAGEVFALFNITAPGHPALGSTVTDKTLHKLHLQVPNAPLPVGSMEMR